MDNEWLELGAFLKKKRAQAGISQHQAAEAIGVPRTAISKIEHGEQKINSLQLVKLADLYGFIPSDLVDKRR